MLPTPALSAAIPSNVGFQARLCIKAVLPREAPYPNTAMARLRSRSHFAQFAKSFGSSIPNGKTPPEAPAAPLVDEKASVSRA